MRVDIGLFLLIACAAAAAAATPKSYKDAEAIWQMRRDATEYQTYAAEFAQLNKCVSPR